MNKKSLMEQVSKNVGSCRKCRLCDLATNPVPGEGDINSEIVFIGEAPGANEDKTGRPFVGRAGQLLERLLTEIGYTRDQVWIGNIIKHRPPNNRDPLPDEITACTPYLKVQLETMKPKLVVTLGRFAMNYFYKEGKISRDHGILKMAGKEWGSMHIFPVYHPAAALRNPNFANTLKEDFIKIPEMLEFVRKKEKNQIEEQTSNDSDSPQLGLF